jgi:hypothetical protein
MVFSGREDKCVLHKRAFRILKRHRKLGRDDASHQDRFPRTHGEGEDVAGVIQRQRFAQAFELKFTYKSTVRTDFFQTAFKTFVGDQADDVGMGEAHCFAPFLRLWVEGFVEFRNFWRPENQTQIPVGFQCPKLSAAQITELTCFVVFDREFKNLADCRIVIAWVIAVAPLVDFS